MKKLLSLLLAVLMLMGMLPVISASAATTVYTLVTDSAQLTDGSKVIIACGAKGVAMGAQSGTYRSSVDVTIADGTISNPSASVEIVTLVAVADAFTLETADGHLYWDTGNTVKTSVESSHTWNISVAEDGTASIVSSANAERLLKYNASSPRFACYSSAQTDIQLYIATELACEHTNTAAIGETKEPTCTEPGITAGLVCTDCGYTIAEQEAIAPLGHSYVNGICSVCQAEEPVGFVLTEAHNIKATDTVIVTMSKNGTVYALGNDKGSSSAPGAVLVEVTDRMLVTEATNVYWNVVYNGGDLIFYPAGTTDTWLYCNASNNGVRVGTNTNNIFTVDATTGYLKHTATSRYLGVYNNQDWRCYTNTTGNTAGQTLGFYVLAGEDSGDTECTHSNASAIPEVSADCTHTGFTAATYCPDCNTYLEGHEPIPALGHSYGEWEITTPAGCDTDGQQTRTCSLCYDVQTEDIPAAGHTYVNGVCSVCGEGFTNLSGRYVIAAQRSNGSVWYMTSDLGTAGTKRYQAVDSGLTAIPSAASSTAGQVFVLELQSDLTYKIYAEGLEGDNYLGWSSGNSGALVSEEEALSLTVAASDAAGGAYNISFTDRNLALNATTGNNYFAFYTSAQANNLYLLPICEHENTVAMGEYVAPTCTTAGMTAGIQCADCGYVLEAQQTLEATGHSFTDSVCTTCGQTADISSASLILGSTLELNVLLASQEEAFTLRAYIGADENYQSLAINENVLIPAHRLYEAVTIQLIYADSVVDTEVWTMEGYAAVLRQDYSQDTEMMALLEALENYGAYADYFADTENGTAPNVAAVEDVSADVFYSHRLEIGTAAPAELKPSASLYLDDACHIRVKFNAAAWNGYTLWVNGEEAAVAEQSGKMIHVIADLIPQQWDDTYEILVKDADGNVVFSVNYSVLSYAFSALNTDPELQTGLNSLLKAMYLYCQAANAYASK